jgi:hypothetical protein
MRLQMGKNRDFTDESLGEYREGIRSLLAGRDNQYLQLGIIE